MKVPRRRRRKGIPKVIVEVRLKINQGM